MAPEKAGEEGWSVITTLEAPARTARRDGSEAHVVLEGEECKSIVTECENW
jgi:hypothetical protein